MVPEGTPLLSIVHSTKHHELKFNAWKNCNHSRTLNRNSKGKGEGLSSLRGRGGGAHNLGKFYNIKEGNLCNKGNLNFVIMRLATG